MPRAVHDPFALPNVRGKPLDLATKRPRSNDIDADRGWLSTLARPWAVDVFCGAGGLSLGLEQAGFNVIAGADNDTRAIETHRANLRGMAWCLDLTDTEAFIDRLAARGVTSVDLVAGGPPCQPFSRAGAAKLRSLVAAGVREANDDRVRMWTAFLNVVDALDPSCVLLENVPDMARWADGEIVVTLLSALRGRGYEADARVLNAWEYGVPQHRARLFIVGTRQPFRWPNRRPRVLLRDAIGDLPRVPPAQREDVIPYISVPTTPFQMRARRGLNDRDRLTIWDHCTRGVRTDDAEAFSLLKEGDTYADLPSRLQRYRSDIFDDKYKRLAWNEVSRTITAHIAKDGYWYIHPEQDRTLSIREAARLQTFPDRFRFAGHPTTQLRQIGNAVPPALAAAVGRRLRSVLDATPADNVHTHPAKILAAWSYPPEAVHPWLRRRDPWLIIVGEMALRRRAMTNGCFKAFSERVPTPADLVANPHERDRLEQLVGTSSAQRLMAIARVLLDQFDGAVPDSQSDLERLPGVGSSLAAAVRSFAFDQPAVILDAGTKRIVSRCSGREISSAWTTRLEIYRLAGQNGPARAFNLSMRALAVSHCTSRGPICDGCPLAPSCAAARHRGGVRASGARATVGVHG